MSITSAVFSPVPGLENATFGQKVDCAVDKVKVIGTYGLASSAALAGTVLASNKAFTNDKFASSVAKVADKAASTKFGTKLISATKNVVKELTEAVKKNPKAAKAAALIGAAGLATTAILSGVRNIKLEQVEDQHQKVVDYANEQDEKHFLFF